MHEEQREVGRPGKRGGQKCCEFCKLVNLVSQSYGRLTALSEPTSRVHKTKCSSCGEALPVQADEAWCRLTEVIFDLEFLKYTNFDMECLKRKCPLKWGRELLLFPDTQNQSRLVNGFSFPVEGACVSTLFRRLLNRTIHLSHCIQSASDLATLPVEF